MKNCGDIRERLSLYLDNELQGDERAAFEAHARACQSCATFIEKERAFLNAIRGSGPLHVASPELRAKVTEMMARIADRCEARPSLLKWILPVAAAVLVLLLPLVVWRGMRQTNRPPNGGPSQVRVDGGGKSSASRAWAVAAGNGIDATARNLRVVRK